ncbi:MAG TPA: FAD-dependent oxidoreductase [Thermoanaerobaculia bacterium]|nr:FAD-dependent oxidoreductase [Thermoanaerobaculia bacterium]
MTPPAELPRLLVLGCGFAGYSLLSRLDRRHWQITLLSPRNYFLFTPLLPSAVSGSVEFRSILEPARRRLPGVRLVEGTAERIDWEKRRVHGTAAVGSEAFSLAFDHLLIAVGAAVSTYGIPGVAEHAVKLASVEGAQAIRRGILEQFARAEIPGLSAEQIAERLRFVVCGGGPTGVEAAAEIHDLLHHELRRDYPELAPLARVVLIEALERLLTGFDSALAAYAHRHFLREGIEVRTGEAVVRLEPGRVHLQSGEVLPSGLILWSGGNTPVPLVESLGEPTERGRLLVDNCLRLSARDRAYAAGDCAIHAAQPLPATAQVAQQQGRYLARLLERQRSGKTVKPFRFRSQGMLAYIGAGQALADLPQVKWSGRTAWLFWRSVYLTKLVSPANKVKVLFDWLKARLFGRDLSRF